MKKAQVTKPDTTTGTEPEWLHEVRVHYALTGGYRPSDIRRILGNPWDTVEIATTEGIQLTSRVV